MKRLTFRSNILKYLLAIIVQVGVQFQGFTQDKRDTVQIQKNTLYAEAFGNCLYGSINYDRIIVNRNKNKVSLRIGMMPYPKITSLAAVTFEVSYFHGVIHHFEYSTGLIYTHILSQQPHYLNNVYETVGSLLITPNIGYRYQKPSGGFFARIGIGVHIKLGEFYRYTPSKHDDTFSESITRISFRGAIGYTFKKSKKSKED